MKKIFFAFIILLISSSAMAQVQNPVQWSYTAKKKASNVYEVVVTAVLEPSWHIYSQNTPSGGPVPTKFTFTKNPLISFEGKVKEVGKLKSEKDNIFGVDVKYYSDKVEFVQMVKLKKDNLKTNVSSTIEYMLCNDSQCLPPTKKTIDIKLQ